MPRATSAGGWSPRLLEAGHRVKVLVRTPQKIADVPWHDQVEIIQDSLSDAGSLATALTGVDVLYYLVHSMASGSGFEAKEESMARLVARAATDAGVDRIVYLGGLHPENAELSIHMRSRETVGRVFLESAVDSIVFQAGVVIGSGSASFEMIRHLAETLPVMPAPSWVNNRVEAIAVRDVLHYLVAAAALPEKLNRSFDVGSRDVLKYKDMMNEYAVERGLPPAAGGRASGACSQARGFVGSPGDSHSVVHVAPLGAVPATRRGVAGARRRRLHSTARRRPDSLPARRRLGAGQGTGRTG